MTTADVFRIFARGESPSGAEAQRADQYLTGWLMRWMREWGSASEEASTPTDQVWSFFADCIEWFGSKKAAFTTANDDEVVRQVLNRFKAYVVDEFRKKREEEGKPWRPERLPENAVYAELVPFSYEQETALTANELEELKCRSLHPTDSQRKYRRRGGTSRADLARDLKELKKEYGWLKRYKNDPLLFDYHFRRILEMERVRDPEQREGYARNVQRLMDLVARTVSKPL